MKLLFGILFVFGSYVIARFFSTRKVENYMLFAFALCICLRIDLFSIGESNIQLVRYYTDYWNFSLIDFFALYLGFRGLRSSKGMLKGKDLIFPALYIFFNMISIIQADNKMASITVTGRAIELFLIYIFFSRKFDPVNQKKYFVKGICFGIWFEGILSILQKIKGDIIGMSMLGEVSTSFRIHEILGNNSQGIAGTFEHSADLALFGLFALCVILFSREIFKRKHVFFATIAIDLVVIYLTDSRTALFLAGCAVVAYVFRNLDSKNGLKIRKDAGVFLLIGIFAITMLIITGSHFAAMFSGMDLLSSWAVRFMQWRIALIEIFKSPIFGYGANNFTDYMYTNYTSFYNAIWNYQNPVHNTFLLFWFDLGIGGFLLAIIMQLYYMIEGIKYRGELTLKFGMGVFVLLTTLYFLTGWAFMKRPIIFFLWIAYGIIANKKFNLDGEP